MFSTVQKDQIRLDYLQDSTPGQCISAEQLNDSLPALPRDGYASMLRLLEAGLVEKIIGSSRMVTCRNHAWIMEVHPRFRAVGPSK